MKKCQTSDNQQRSMLCSSLRDRIQFWFCNYARVQSYAMILVYAQIGCALIGSLGALYSGVSLINLAIALFALVATESNIQSLARTYAVLLFSAILLDISWFILFTKEIWSISPETYGTFFVFSVKLTLAMEIIGFSLRLLSSLLWIQIYRLGAPHLDSDLRNSFLNPSTPAIASQCSGSEEILRGSIYDPAYYVSVSEDGQGSMSSPTSQANRFLTRNSGSPSSAEASHMKASISRSLQAIDASLQACHE